jgi:hypothetical protein
MMYIESLIVYIAYIRDCCYYRAYIRDVAYIVDYDFYFVAGRDAYIDIVCYFFLLCEPADRIPRADPFWFGIRESTRMRRD